MIWFGSIFFMLNSIVHVVSLKYFGKTNKNKPAAQAASQTLPDATPPVGKIPPFRKLLKQ